MTGEAYAPELLVLPRGIKALCEDQGMQTAILASLPTLDDGGLAVRQVRGDPNRGSGSLAPRWTAPSTLIQAPASPATEPRLPPVGGRSRRQPALGAAGTARRTGRGGSTARQILYGGAGPQATEDIGVRGAE
jgi:hypothetical protein